MTIIQFILALPKLFNLFKQIQQALAVIQEKQKEHQAQKLADAKTESEVKDAARDYLKN